MRKVLSFLLLICFVSCFLPGVFAEQPCSIIPVNLQAEYLADPMGLDEKTPRFSWTQINVTGNPGGRIDFFFRTRTG